MENLMHKHLKTLLIASVILLPISACSGHLHGKNDTASVGSAHCKMTKNMEKAQKSADKVLKELDEAAANATDEATKKNLKKIIKEADKLANDIGQCKRMCDAKAAKGESAPAEKAKHKKAHHAAKPAAATPAAAPAPAATVPATAKPATK